MTLLEISDLTIEFSNRRGSRLALDGVSLAVDKGEILGVVGESGAGKSTIGNAIIGLLQRPGRVVGGLVKLNGARIDNSSPEEFRKIRGRRIGTIFQDPLTALDPLQTVGAQLIETIRYHLGLSLQDATERALGLLASVGIAEPETRALQYPHQFSGGMRQRVVIALALCCDPELIIADEPTTALDASIQTQIIDLLRAVCVERQVGIIVITHDIGVISELTHRVAVLNQGKLVEEGPTQQILLEPRHPYTKRLISAVPRADRKLSRFPVMDRGEDAVPGAPSIDIDLDTHWLFKGGRKQPGGESLIETRGLDKTFLLQNSFRKKNRKFFQAVKNVNFAIGEGEVFGLVGESGSGKSTVARLIAGLHNASGGDVMLGGVSATDPERRAEIKAFRRQVQMIFQDPYSSLNPRMRVQDIVAEPIRFHRTTSNEDETRAVVENLIRLVGMGSDALLRFPHEFSGGQRQRICIARALASRPRFLICDEPTSALDVSVQAQILNLLKDLQEKLGLTMLFISHDLPVIRQMCDRVGVMRHGELLEVENADQLFESPRHEYSRHLLSLIPKFSL